MSIGPTHVGHYSREDYARMQKMQEASSSVDTSHTREPVWYRNSTAEGEPNAEINPGYRSLYSLQLANNEHIVRSLLKDPIFSIGYGPDDVGVTYPDDYVLPPYIDRPINRPQQPANKAWNLRLDRELEKSITADVYTIDDDRSESIMKPRPAVNPPMLKLGDSISLNSQNTRYNMMGDDGTLEEVDSDDL